MTGRGSLRTMQLKNNKLAQMAARAFGREFSVECVLESLRVLLPSLLPSIKTALTENSKGHKRKLNGFYDAIRFIVKTGL